MPIETADYRYYGFSRGVVTHSEDPLKLGRVRVRIPGLIEPHSAWALPFAMPGAGKSGSGRFDPPDVGQDVAVTFVDGDPDYPMYTYAHWGIVDGESEVPEPAKTIMEEDGPASATKIKAYENERFQVFHDLRENKGRFVIRSKRQDLEDLEGAALMLEFDDENGTIALSAPAGISIKSVGAIELEALTITLNGRPVVPTKKMI